MKADTQRWITLRQLERWLDTPMALLGLLWLGLVVVELTAGSSRLLDTIGTAIWIAFIAEFLLRFSLAPAKWRFLKSNWLTLLALAVPAVRMFRVLRIARAARALRGIRLVKIVGAANRSMNALRKSLRRRGAGYVAGLTLLVLALGAAGMLSFEPANQVEGGFASYPHALWWTAMLLTTIGSDYWPVTTEGRILALLLSIYALAMLGYIAAAFASFFVGREAEDSAGPVAGNKDIEKLSRQIAALRTELERTAD